MVLPCAILSLLETGRGWPTGTGPLHWLCCRVHHHPLRRQGESARSSTHKGHVTTSSLLPPLFLSSSSSATSVQVTYEAEGFCDRNRDVLYKDLVELMQSSQKWVHHCRHALYTSANTLHSARPVPSVLSLLPSSRTTSVLTRRGDRLLQEARSEYASSIKLFLQSFTFCPPATHVLSPVSICPTLPPPPLPLPSPPLPM